MADVRVAANIEASRGRLVDIGGRRLRAVFDGREAPGRPLVILEAGAFGTSADWAIVQTRLAERGVRSLSYDRAGLGFSDPGASPRDGAAIVADLEALLAACGEEGPFILCGHSMAGLFLRLLAARRRTAVRGVVLVDATTPEAIASKLVDSLVGHFTRLSRLAAWVARIGLFRSFASGAWGDRIGLTGAAAAEKRWAFASPRHNHWSAEEVAAWRATAAEASAAEPFDPQWPVSVILADRRSDRPDLWRIQTEPARASRAGSIREVAGADHATLLGPEFALVIVSEIERVIGAGGG